MGKRNPSSTLTTLFSLVCIVVSNLSSAAPADTDYGSLPAISFVRVSPEGRFIGFRKVTSQEDMGIVYSLEKNKAVAGFSISNISPENMYFIDENQLIVRASQEKYIRGYEDPRMVLSTAFIYDVGTNTFKQLLTPGDKIYTGQTGLGRIAGINKNKKYAYMPAYVGDSDTDNSPDFSLMRVNLASPKRPHVHEKGNRNTLDYFIDSGGNTLAREDYNNRTNKHSILVPNGRKWTTIYEHKSEIPVISPIGLTSNRRSLVALHNDKKTGYTGYITLSLADGSTTATNFGRDDADIETVLTDINRIVYGVKYTGFTPSYKFFDDKLNTRVQKIIEKFPGHSVSLSDWSRDWKHLVFYVAGSSYAGEYYLFSEGKPPQFIASAYPGIRPEDIHPVGTVSFKASDGMRIPTLLTIPRASLDNMKNLPAIMLPHGGPESYDQIEFDWLAQALANRGYLVIQPQFRGSDGFGTAHRVAGHGEWGGKMQDDLTDAIAFLKRKGIINPDQVCIAGISYGGYAALAGGAFTPNLYQCVISINGVSDIPAMIASEKSDHGRNHWVVSYWENIIAEGKKDKAFLKSISPSNFAKNFSVPVLLLHGEKDKIVPYKQSKVMNKKLKKAGKNVRLVKLKGENHHLKNRKTRLETLKSVLAFLDQHLTVNQAKPAE